MLKAAARYLMPTSKFGYNLPDPSWFTFVSESSRFTPDVAKLETYEYQLFFACDETQRGHADHKLIDDGAYVCPAFTQASFNYWLPESPLLPAVPMEASGLFNTLPNEPPISKIKGEVHAIRPYQFLNLDTDRENGVQFLRKRVRLIVPYRAIKYLHDINCPPPDIERIYSGRLGLTYEKIVTLRAWMYVGVPAYWDKLISAYDYSSVKTFEARNRQWCSTYYQLRK